MQENCYKICENYKSFFKAKDLRLFNQIKGFLDEHNLEFKLKGEIIDNAKKSNLRQYKNISLVVHDNNPLSEKYELKNQLLRMYSGFVLDCDPLFSKDIVSVKESSNNLYSNKVNDEVCFEIFSFKSKTTLNLIFEKDNT